MSKNSDNGVIVPDNREYEEKIKSLHTGAALIGRAGSTKELYNSITKTMNDLLGYPLSGLSIPDKDHIHFVKTIHESHGIDFSLPLDVPTISTRAYREKTTQIVNDVRKDPDCYAGPKGTESGPIVLSSLDVPILVEDKVRAILNLASIELGKFSQMDVEILEILGMHISSAFIRIDQINEIFESETRLQAIMSQAADAIILMDVKDKIIFWNPAAERLFDYEKKESRRLSFYTKKAITPMPQSQR